MSVQVSSSESVKDGDGLSLTLKEFLALPHETALALANEHLDSLTSYFRQIVYYLSDDDNPELEREIVE
jgi:hypothetical protein